MQDSPSEYTGDEIAIVGMALRVPGANTVDTFWNNLKEGKESVEQYTDQQLRDAGVPIEDINDPRYVKAGASMAEVKHFDPAFFGISPFDAQLMDPQHRQFLEIAWEALEHAGEDAQRYPGSIAVYGGSGQNSYLFHNLLTNGRLIKNPGYWYLRHVGNDKDFMTTRLSYHLNLTGPSINVQTACSTSLVSVHLGTQSLLNRECDMVLAGGVTVLLPLGQGYMFQDGGIQDPTGHCRAFDVHSRGTVFSSGGAVLVLKRLEDAQREKNTIHGVILGSAVNNDGSGKAGFTAPSIDGQVSAIVEALEVADVDPQSIGYMEAHGTGTPIGDPIEVAALTEAWAQGADKQGYCAISSLKTNIGHVDMAAGAAGLIKIVGAVKHGLKYPTVHFTAPNPALNLEQTPFYASNECEHWSPVEQKRRAAISSFGVGGTNAHVIIEEPPRQTDEVVAATGPFVLPLSARSASAVSAYRLRLAEFLGETSEALSDIAFTLSEGRSQLEVRGVALCKDKADAIAVLSGENPDAWFEGESSERAPEKVAFSFTGQGSQYVNMGKGLYESDAYFRKHFDFCAELLIPLLGEDLRQLVFIDDPSEEDRNRINQTAITQPALFALEYSVARCWENLGVKADAMIGHSIGEYVAATLAGVFKLEDALRLVCMRGKLMQSAEPGDMLAVTLPEADADQYLGEDVSLAAVNAYGVSVLSGTKAAIAAVKKRMDIAGVAYTALVTSHAFHSAMMDPILDAFREEVSKCQLNPPGLPFVSNVSGTWITDNEATDADYWVRHLRSTVRFADGANCILNDPAGHIFIEVGPGSTLTNLINQHPAKGGHNAATWSVPGPKDKQDAGAAFRLGMGRLWCVGYHVDWAAQCGEQSRRIPLPTYAWDHNEYWVDSGESALGSIGPSLARRELPDWFYQPGWRKSSLPVSAGSVSGKALIVASELSPMVQAVSDAMGERGLDCEIALRGLEGDAGQGVYRFDAGSEQGVEALLNQAHRGQTLQCLIEFIQDRPAGAGLDEFYQCYFDQPLAMAKTLATVDAEQPMSYMVVGKGLLSVADDAELEPAKALVQGPLKALGAENPCVNSALVDIGEPRQHRQAILAKRLVDEAIGLDGQVAEIAYRGNERYQRAFDPQPFSEGGKSLLKEGGHYLITGGGGLALSLAENLASQYKAHVYIVSRSVNPDAGAWQDLCESANARLASRYTSLVQIDKQAASLSVYAADVSDTLAMQQLLSDIAGKCENLNGIFHSAGIVDDGLLISKEPEAAHRVLDPKAKALDVFDQYLKNKQLDFLMLYSSVSSLAGNAGQADYISANAYLNAYANQRSAELGFPVVAVNWGTWAETGMAMELALEQGIVESEAPLENSGLYSRVRSTRVKEKQLIAEVSPDTHWVLNDHRTAKGLALIPGTAYIDLAATGFKQIVDCAGIEIKDLLFMAAFTVVDSETKVLASRFDMTGNERDFVISSARSIEAAREQDWQNDHVRGVIRALDEARPEAMDVATLKSNCGLESEEFGGTLDHKQLIFGRRWNCLNTIDYGHAEALVSLELQDQFVDDLKDFPLHAAMLDMAIGAHKLIPGFEPDKDFYVPVSYRSIKIYGALEKSIYSYVRYVGDAQSESAEFDVTLLNKAGEVLMEVGGFLMRRVDFDALDQIDAPSEEAVETASPPANAYEPGLFETSLMAGILPAEGFEAIEQILSGELVSQLVVSPIDIESYIAQARLSAGSDSDDDEDDSNATDRPDLSVDFAEPESTVEKKVAKIWRSGLGVKEVGLDDDFFELGGHSLLLTQIVARVKKTLNVNIPISQFFEETTIRQWVALIGDTGDSGPALPLVVYLDRKPYEVEISELAGQQ